MLIFVEGGKPENLEKNPQSKDENQQQTHPTYDTGSGNCTRATLIGGERDHHCAIPAPLKYLKIINILSKKANKQNLLDGIEYRMHLEPIVWCDCHSLVAIFLYIEWLGSEQIFTDKTA